MLSPEPMRHATVLVPAEEVEATARAIAGLGVLHLLDVRAVDDLLPAAIGRVDVGDRAARLAALTRVLDGVLDALGVAPDPDAGAGYGDRVDVAAAAAEADALAGEVDDLRARLAAAEEEALQEEALPALRALLPLGRPLDRLAALRWVHAVVGSVPERELPGLRQRLAEVPHVLDVAGSLRPEERVLVVGICRRDDAEALERTLRASRFERLQPPARLDGDPAAMIAQLEVRLDEVRRRRAALLEERRALAGRAGPAALRLRALAERERLLLEAERMIGRSERVAIVSGWVPAALASRLEQVVVRATAGRCLLEWQDPGALAGVHEGRIAVPILLRNPLLVRPFERLLRGYGLPRYGELDPTPVVALAFLTMFGFMFGDVGQGAVLFVLGWVLHRRMFRFRDYAVILMEAGVFAAAFGILYGSVFGTEHWLPALWLRPLDDIQRLVTTALAFGAGLLSVGLLLNLANAVRRRDLAELWERNGLVGAVAYWIAVGLFFRRLTAGPGAVTLGTALLWLAVPLGLILLREPVRELWAAARERRRPEGAELLALAIQSLVEVLDTALGYLANTATFIRLAAFAMSHAGLCLATFSVAHAVADAGGGTLGAVLVVVVGNVVVIALEGMVVAIQSIRLEYYELFSRFYGGGGEEYRPLRLPAASGGGVPRRWTHA